MTPTYRTSLTLKKAIAVSGLLIMLALCLVILKDTTGIKTTLLIGIGTMVSVITLPTLLNINARWITRAVIAVASALILSGIHAFFK